MGGVSTTRTLRIRTFGRMTSVVDSAAQDKLSFCCLHEPVGADFNEVGSRVFLPQLLGVGPIEEIEVESDWDRGVLPQTVARGCGRQHQTLKERHTHSFVRNQ